MTQRNPDLADKQVERRAVAIDHAGMNCVNMNGTSTVWVGWIPEHVRMQSHRPSSPVSSTTVVLSALSSVAAIQPPLALTYGRCPP
jgi:hypothetical protein